MSEPVRPITYYIDRTVPVEWRPFVRAGILEWNRAFEEAGYRDAIRVLDAPDDSAWSAADARYSTVRWTATNGRYTPSARPMSIPGPARSSTPTS